MNEPIISPWMVYLLSRLDMINCLLAVGTILSIVSLAITIMILGENYELDSEKGKRVLVRVVCVIVGFATLSVIVPSKQDAIAIYAASKITPANIQAVGESADKAADKVVEKIIRVIDAVKEEKKDK